MKERYTLKELIKTCKLFSQPYATIAADYISEFEYPWEALCGIKEYILKIGQTLDKDKFFSPSEGIWIARSAVVFSSAYIGGPCIIDEGAEVRHCAFIRGSAIVGKNCVVGNSTELKNVILFDGVQVPHFNYVGDSILGYKAHMGAGAVTSNLKSDKSLVSIKLDGETLPTGRKKLGALVGDEVEVGCNSVLCPGTLLGRRSQVYPTSCVRGVVKEQHIYKDAQHIVPRV